MEQTGNIYTAINKVMEQVGYVRKSRGANLNYSFAGEAALIAAIRPEMVSEGIFCHVADVRDVEVREYSSKSGSAMTNVSLTAVIRFWHVSGTFIDVMARGEGSDSGDKANNKAMTCAYKYALRQTFCIETGDDPDRFQPAEKSQPGAAQYNATPAQVEQPTPVTDWPTDFINLLATEFGIAAPRVKATMQYCKLPKTADYAVLSEWMNNYKTARGEDKTTAEAAEIANSFNAK